MKRKETAYETRLRERFQQRADRRLELFEHIDPRDGRNREERRYSGDTVHHRYVPKFRTVEQADRWLEKQARKA